MNEDIDTFVIYLLNFGSTVMFSIKFFTLSASSFDDSNYVFFTLYFTLYRYTFLDFILHCTDRIL